MKSEMTALSVYGLEDLIAGVTPTFSGWTNDPTDAADITDGDITTCCATGNKVCGAGWQNAIFEWDLGKEYPIVITGVGKAVVTAGLAYIYSYIYTNGSWKKSSTNVAYTNRELFMATGGLGSKIRLVLTNSAACTISPVIREVHVWRLK